ncbi:MAG: hypothetical protein Fues2KO_27600 [Fuerstiella sp.]
MKTILPIVKWMIVIVLAVTVAAGGGAYYLLNQKERLVQEEVLRQFHEAAPDLKLKIGGTRLDKLEAVEFRDVEIRDRSTGQPLLRVANLRADLDAQQLIEQHQIVIRTVDLLSADLLLVREADGRWNWQQYTFEPPRKKRLQLPAIKVDDAAVRLVLKHGPHLPPAELLLQQTTLQAIPSSAHGYDFDGAIELPGAGMLKLAGAWNLQTQTWQLGGNLRDVRADQQLMQIAKATAPQIDGQLERLDAVIEHTLPPRSAGERRTPGAALQIGNNSAVAPQFQGMIDLDFAVSGDAEQKIPKFKLLLNIRDGRLQTPVIPFALTDVQARLFRDNDSIAFQLQNAIGNNASLQGGFEKSYGDQQAPGHAWFDVKRFPVTERLEPVLPEKMLRLFQAFDPDVLLSVSGEWKESADGRWKPHDIKAEIHEGSAEYHKIRYRAEKLAGKIEQRPYRQSPATDTEPAVGPNDVMLDVAITGQMGPRPFTASGWWKNPGPVTETRFEMDISDFPLDRRFRNALQNKEQQVFDSLDLTGTATAHLIFYRPPGLDRVTQTFVDAQIFDARMKFSRFPYEIEQLRGRVTYNSATRHWQFPELFGQHQDCLLSASGDFKGDPNPGVLDLTVSATGASLDADLYNALPPPQRSIWNMINPNGYCDLTAQIDWTAVPGQPPVVTFPPDAPVRIYNTKIRPEPFPFDMTVQEAVVSFDPNDVRAAGAQHCEIHSFRATHGDASITARQCWAEAKPNGEWQLHFNHLSADDLQPDDSLRAALPASWRETLTRMHQTGRVSINDSELDFRGAIDGSSNTTAGWKLNATLRDCTVNAGLDVNHIYGSVTARGAWDGYRLKNVGEIDLETAEVLDMPFTNLRGPYSLNDVELVLGSRQIFQQDSVRSDVDPASRIKGLAYGGEVMFDASVDLREGGTYRFFTEVANAKLESYAALHMPEQRNLKGIVTAWMALDGTDQQGRDLNGKGQLRISPAALYEVPVVVKLLGSLSQGSLDVQDRTAFNWALLNFNVKDDAFQFDEINLVGESISFRGRGMIGFDGAVDLDFYSRPARSRATALPFISGLFTNWAKVEVRGTTDRPQTVVRSAARIDEGLRMFLQPFNPNPAGPIPRLTIPRAFQ